MFDSLASSEDGEQSSEAYRIGIVVFNSDPARQQRVKVVVPGFLEDDNAENLPWVGPIRGSEFGLGVDPASGLTFGDVKVPKLGSALAIKFQGGDPKKGLYVGSASPVAVAAGMPSQLSTNYPHRVGSWDTLGTVIYRDTATGLVGILHKSGTVLEIAPNGNISVTCVGTVTGVATQWNVTGNMSVTGNVSITGTLDTTGAVSGGSTITAVGALRGSSVGNAAGLTLEGHHHNAPNGPTSAAIA